MYYRHFRVHCSLNIASGEVTIKNLIRNHSGVYIPQINGVKGKPVELKIISPVPVPTLSASCDADTCVLKCDGNTAGVEMVTYKWKSDDAELPISSKEYTIEKESSRSISAFSCELKNPVSQETSEPVANPFHTSGGLKINSGLTVFITLLAVLLLLVLIHRWKAGSWFYEKDALPWEADFWRKHSTPRRDAAEANGIKAHQEQGQGEGEGGEKNCCSSRNKSNFCTFPFTSVTFSSNV
uniref:Ig-like domain-containing protein n=1 Tax=Echeneis naucrates TaxID=173247 RepID=A0A665W731_ECHNA